ncbi:carbon-nitrogen family hydrolase [Caldibacillus lycopersici]|uniref:Carbon-nitrogen family hydrolase n=1 Tax=Perspicuibacillus lycopersici TaxID=1325689 RepID=A0AAE3IP51_9BACI|nr:carbon-nitrogen family hydrolase [Perspicuibacillus lycopersici]MCU9612008.1 carbon-nitrogen family hydrolase [Perspicuibacillus lycopersici]
MKIACVQMDIQFANPENNFTAITRYVEEAARNDADIVVFPEMWNTGYALDKLESLADLEGEATKKLIASLAQIYTINIVAGSVSTKRQDQFYNTMYVANRLGHIVAKYDKAHLFKLMEEHLFLQPGKKTNIFQLDNTICGGVICYDLRFPEWIRKHVLSGANIIFVPAQWPDKRIDHWQILLQARAIENQCYIVAVNRVGEDPNNKFNGHSMVVAPWGEILLRNQTDSGIFYTTLDLSEVDRVRNTIPVFSDRREELYQ